MGSEVYGIWEKDGGTLSLYIPPATEQDSKGNYIHKKPICYVDSWYVGFTVLNVYRAGTYKPGDEFDFAQKQTADASQYDDIALLSLKLVNPHKIRVFEVYL